MADTPILITARKLVATSGAEEEALREIANLRFRYPALTRVGPPLLREVHLRNSDQFGDAAARVDFELLSAVQESLESAAAPVAARPAGAMRSSPGIACQQMLAAAYDPAAALVVIANSMSRETPLVQPIFHSVILQIAQTLDRPGMWQDPYATLRKDRPSATGKIVSDIRDMLRRIDLLKMQSTTFATLIKEEIAQKARSPQAESVYGPMLHVLHAQLQRMRGAGA